MTNEEKDQKGADAAAVDAACSVVQTPQLSHDEQALVRYGIRWLGPKEPICEPRADGFWTPWHIATETVDALKRENLRLHAEVGRLLNHPGIDPFADGSVR